MLKREVILTNPHICGQCDSMHRSCCTLRAENNDGLPAPVSKSEIERIFKSLKGKKREDLLEKKNNSRQFINQMSMLFPDLSDSVPIVFPINKTHFELKTVNDNCIFKDSNGCILPVDDRPLFCRLYPFWFFDDEPRIIHDSNCLALEKSLTISEIFLSFGTNTDKLKQIHARMCEDWGLYRSIPQEKKRVLL